MKKQKATEVYDQQLDDIVYGLEKWLPLTVRQVHYQMVKNLYTENTISAYKKVSRRLAFLRQNYEMHWEAIADRTRRLVEKRGVASLEAYVKKTCENLFKVYSRCLVQQQEKYVELWTEKDALAGIFEEVAWTYCVKVVVCRGQLSRTFLHDYAERAEAAIYRGLEPVIVYGGDLDPTGIQIPLSIESGLWKHFGIEVEVDRFALNLEQIEAYNLPVDFKAAKETDPNYAKFVKWYGTMAVELDALDPEDLQKEIKAGLARHLDISAMVAEQAIEKKERKEMVKIRKAVLSTIQGLGYDV